MSGLDLLLQAVAYNYTLLSLLFNRNKVANDGDDAETVQRRARRLGYALGCFEAFIAAILRSSPSIKSGVVAPDRFSHSRLVALRRHPHRSRTELLYDLSSRARTAWRRAILVLVR
jgi:hypothetical protein